MRRDSSPTELTWPSTWTDRRDRYRTPVDPRPRAGRSGHRSRLRHHGTVGGTASVRPRRLVSRQHPGGVCSHRGTQPRAAAGDVDFTVGASLPISGLTAWQGLFEHGRLQAGQSVLAHGAAGAVGSMVTQLAREAGAYVIGTGRAADRQKALDFGAKEFVDLDNDSLEDVGEVDLVFDVIGGDTGSGPQA
jgi:NADPH:quinone reductase-like Zn-dependent oxidoreductase